MTEYRVLWTRTAREDLEAIIEYVAADSPANALRVLQRLQAKTATLVRHPQRGRVVPELRTVDVLTYRELVAQPWRIVYRVEARRVYVMAVLDGRRDLSGLLLERLLRS